MTDLNCAEARERLLVADPEELRDRSRTTLGRHLAGCEPCAARAASILRGQRDLDDALSRIVAEATSGAPDISPRRRRLLTPRVALPLAAAAAVLLMIAGERWAWGGDDAELPTPEQVAATQREPIPFVTPPEDRNVAVFDTGNPRITVVWMF